MGWQRADEINVLRGFPVTFVLAREPTPRTPRSAADGSCRAIIEPPVSRYQNAPWYEHYK